MAVDPTRRFICYLMGLVFNHAECVTNFHIRKALIGNKFGCQWLDCVAGTGLHDTWHIVHDQDEPPSCMTSVVVCFWEGWAPPSLLAQEALHINEYLSLSLSLWFSTQIYEGTSQVLSDCITIPSHGTDDDFSWINYSSFFRKYSLLVFVFILFFILF